MNTFEIIEKYPQKFCTDTRKAMFIFGTLIETVRDAIPSKRKAILQENITPFAVGRKDVDKAFQKLYTFVQSLVLEYGIDVSKLQEYISEKVICGLDFSEYEELQFCFTLGMSLCERQEWITFTEAAEICGYSDGSVFRKKMKEGKFRTSEIRQSGSTWLITKSAAEKTKKPRESEE